MDITKIFSQIHLKLLMSIYQNCWSYTNDKYQSSEKKFPKVILMRCKLCDKACSRLPKCPHSGLGLSKQLLFRLPLLLLFPGQRTPEIMGVITELRKLEVRHNSSSFKLLQPHLHISLNLWKRPSSEFRIVWKCLFG